MKRSSSSNPPSARSVCMCRASPLDPPPSTASASALAAAAGVSAKRPSPLRSSGASPRAAAAPASSPRGHQRGATRPRRIGPSLANHSTRPGVQPLCGMSPPGLPRGGSNTPSSRCVFVVAPPAHAMSNAVSKGASCRRREASFCKGRVVVAAVTTLSCAPHREKHVDAHHRDCGGTALPSRRDVCLETHAQRRGDVTIITHARVCTSRRHARLDSTTTPPRVARRRARRHHLYVGEECARLVKADETEPACGKPCAAARRRWLLSSR